MYQWTGNVGLVNVSDVLKASTNPLCTSASYSHDAWDMSCNNYLFFSQSRYWTINPINVSDLWAVNSDFVIDRNSHFHSIIKVIEEGE